MKRLRPNFQRSNRLVSVGFLIAIAGIFLALTVHAGTVPAPPPWIPFELKAISLYGAGLSQESSDPQGAVNTLRQAREESTAAITNGGGSNPAVMHNDLLIGQALMLAQADASRPPENTNAAPSQNSQKSGSAAANTARPAGNHLHATATITRR
jgi:hypothetical protein